MSDPVLAVRELRAACGDSQEKFAARAGLSARALANYERDRAPNPKALFQFAKIANELGRNDLAARFSRALQEQVGDAAIDISDDLQRSAVTAIQLNNDSDWLDRQLANLIKNARLGRPLAYPPVFLPDSTPDQTWMINYLEDLRVKLRLRTAPSAKGLLDDMARERSEQTGETKDGARFEIMQRNRDLYERYNEELAAAASAKSSATGDHQSPTRPIKPATKTKAPRKSKK